MDCKEGTCNMQKHEHHHHRHCNCNCGCSDKKQKSGSQEWAKGCDMTAGLLMTADKAWESLMVDKMKAEWENLRGKHMDKMAKAAVETAMAYWQGKMQEQGSRHEHMEKIKSAFM